MTIPSSGKQERNGLAEETSIALLSFDELLEKLDEVVQQLETDQLSLDASIETYERGVKLAMRCQQLLNDAELRISQIADELGGTAPYPPSRDGSDDDDEPA